MVHPAPPWRREHPLVSALTRSDCIKQAQLIKAQHRADAREVKYKTDKTVRDLMTDYIAALPSDTFSRDNPRL